MSTAHGPLPIALAHCPVPGSAECAERVDNAWWMIGFVAITPVYAVTWPLPVKNTPQPQTVKKAQNQQPARPRATKQQGQGPICQHGQGPRNTMAKGRLSAQNQNGDVTSRIDSSNKCNAASALAHSSARWPRAVSSRVSLGAGCQGRGYQCGGVGSVANFLFLAGIA